MPQDWTALASGKKASQQAAIPKEWLLFNPPSLDTQDVTEFPDTCGLLTEEDIQITKSDTETLLSKLASGEWSSLKVTTAFYKRAIIAQQLVSI